MSEGMNARGDGTTNTPVVNRNSDRTGTVAMTPIYQSLGTKEEKRASFR
jgi:hypothetical protein